MMRPIRRSQEKRARRSGEENGPGPSTPATIASKQSLSDRPTANSPESLKIPQHARQADHDRNPSLSAAGNSQLQHSPSPKVPPSTVATRSNASRVANPDRQRSANARHGRHPSRAKPPDPNEAGGCRIAKTMGQGAALCDIVAARMSIAISRFDGDDAGTAADSPPPSSEVGSDDMNQHEGRPLLGLIDFKKTWCYANSRLPPHVRPVKLYTETWPILCRAADASLAVYSRQLMRTDERENYIDADWHRGTKAMVLRSTTLDDRKLIILAVRGSKWNLADWAVNFRPSPTAPVGFLEDDGNACHAGFLAVARAMVRPAAACIRDLLRHRPARCDHSLVFTGHSAGGAVASLLYAHMLSTGIDSDLTTLASRLRRVHCVTFGAPPVTLMPLQKPPGARGTSSVFFSFVNEGDPVVRADREYLGTLYRIIAGPMPDIASKHGRSDGVVPRPPLCRVPESTLSNAGRLVVLRTKPGRRSEVEAVGVEDAELRPLVFGDPAMHAMTLYRQRIDRLAIVAITGHEAT